jgi:hypothetical protein
MRAKQRYEWRVAARAVVAQKIFHKPEYAKGGKIVTEEQLGRWKEGKLVSKPPTLERQTAVVKPRDIPKRPFKWHDAPAWTAVPWTPEVEENFWKEEREKPVVQESGFGTLVGYHVVPQDFPFAQLFKIAPHLGEMYIKAKTEWALKCSDAIKKQQNPARFKVVCNSSCYLLMNRRLNWQGTPSTLQSVVDKSCLWCQDVSAKYGRVPPPLTLASFCGFHTRIGGVYDLDQVTNVISKFHRNPNKIAVLASLVDELRNNKLSDSTKQLIIKQDLVKVINSSNIPFTSTGVEWKFQGNATNVEFIKAIESLRVVFVDYSLMLLFCTWLVAIFDARTWKGVVAATISFTAHYPQECAAWVGELLSACESVGEAVNGVMFQGSTELSEAIWDLVSSLSLSSVLLALDPNKRTWLGEFVESAKHLIAKDIRKSGREFEGFCSKCLYFLQVSWQKIGECCVAGSFAPLWDERISF